MRKIKFVTKHSVDEYVHPDQKLASWGGNDSWAYEFIEEKIVVENGHKESSVSSEDDLEVSPVVAANPAASEQLTVPVEHDRKISLNTLPTVYHSIDNDARKFARNLL